MSEQRNIKILIKTTRFEVDASLFSTDDMLDEIETEPAENTEPDELEIKTEGIFEIKDGRIEMSYDESDITGMEGSRTCVYFDTIADGVVTMLRTGTVSTSLTFEQGKRHHCVYNTPYMPFEVCVKTLSVKNEIAEIGELSLDYVVEIRGAKAERTKFFMKIMN